MPTIMPTRTRAVERALVDERQAPSRREVAPGRVFVGVLIWVIHWKVAVPADSPTRIGPYLIRQELGRGGMGVVWAALDERLHRHVAIKALLPRGSEGSDQLSHTQERVLREARAIAAVQHPNVASIYDVVEHAGAWYVVMELVAKKAEGDRYVRTETLAHRLASGPVSLDETLRLGAQIAGALGAAHVAGINHRDLKPSNILLAANGDAKVVDFGLSRAHGSDVDATPQVQREPLDETSCTLSLGDGRGSVSGSPGYMSPEQWAGEPADASQDIFALGCVLFECLSGVRAFRERRPPQHQEVSWDRFPSNLPAGIIEVLQGCLAIEPSQRFRDAGDVRVLLERLRASLLEAPSRLSAVRSMPSMHARDAMAGRASSSAAPEPESRRDQSQRGWWRSRGLLAFAGSLAAFLLSWFVVLPMLPWSEGRVVAVAAASPASSDASVLVLGFTRDDMVKAREAMDVGGVFDPTVKETWRPIHGKMIERLVKARAKCIAFDVRFGDPTDPANHAPLVQAVTQATRQGVPVVLGTKSWHRDAFGLPSDTAPDLLQAGASWGTMLVQQPGSNEVWTVEAGLERRGMEIGNLGLALEAATRFRTGLASHQTRFLVTDSGSDWIGAVRMLKVKEGRAGLGGAVQDGQDQPVKLRRVYTVKSNVLDAEPELAEQGYQIEDRVAEFAAIPRDAGSREAMLMRYAEGAALSDDELTRRAKGKAVLIGAMEDDQIPLPDGSEAAGVFLHAAALADMLKDRGVQEFSSLGVMVWCAFASVAGCVVCIFAPRLWQLVVGLIILGGMSAIAAGVLPRASLWAELPVGLTMLAVAACVGLGVRMVVSRKVA